ncbi:MAG TPA: hemerythrin domain-containing protein [Candidatus Binatia bacterium]|nr:hemerythrin domain-containing protein [Candidatus Binatia bacterium]
MEATTLIERLRRDHERVLRDITELEGALVRSAPATRGAAAEERIGSVLAMLERQFQTHMAAEDQILYPAISRAIPASAPSLEPLHDEHAELRQMLHRLQATLGEPKSADRDEQIPIQVHDLADLLRLHIRKEESLVFHVAARLLADEEIAAVLKRMNGDADAAGAETRKPLLKKGSSR